MQKLMQKKCCINDISLYIAPEGADVQVHTSTEDVSCWISVYLKEEEEVNMFTLFKLFGDVCCFLFFFAVSFSICLPFVCCLPHRFSSVTLFNLPLFKAVRPSVCSEAFCPVIFSFINSLSLRLLLCSRRKLPLRTALVES